MARSDSLLVSPTRPLPVWILIAVWRARGPVTAAIADELSNQYDLGYVLTGKKDGRWHAIRVEVRNSSYRVRARKGYLAS